MSSEKIKVAKGLEGVVVDTTSISNVHAEKSQLFYRGEEVSHLARNKSFDEVAYLLMKDGFPSDSELLQFQKEERHYRAIPDALVETLRGLHKAHPMDALRTSISYIGALDEERTFDNQPETNWDKFMRLYAQIPLCIAAHYRLSKGLPVLDSNADLGRSENFFYLCFGHLAEPHVIRAFEASMILYAEHSFNASTFAARVISSTTSDLYSAVTGAVGALKGPLHGGANEQVMYLLQELLASDLSVEEWLKTQLSAKRKIMGFGHRVYKKGDSRVPTMQHFLEELAKGAKADRLLSIHAELEKLMREQKNILPNLDYPAGPAYHMMGFDVPLFTPIFVMSRIVGWSAHIMEQLANNRIIRPLSEYIGR